MKGEQRTKKGGKWKTVAVSATVLLAVYIVAGLIFSSIMMKRAFARSDKRGYFSAYLAYEDVKSEFPREDVTFSSGANKLTGAIYGQDDALGTVVIVHGYGGDKDTYLPQIQYFVQNDWLVFTYNGTGVNDSGGGSRVNLYQAVTDLRNALDYLDDTKYGNLPIVLLGHSQGGYAVCSVLNHEESADVKAVVSFAGMNYAGESVYAFARQSTGALYPLLKPFIYFVDHTDFTMGAENNAVNGINKADIPVLLIQGVGDDTVTPDIAITNYTGEIKNTRVEIKFLDDEWNNGHNSVFWSEEAFRYRNEVNAGLASFIAENNIETLTDNDLHNWANAIGLDRVRINQLDKSLFDQINGFYERAIYE